MLRHNSMTLKFSFIVFFFIHFFCIRLSISAVLAPIKQDPFTRRFLLSLYLKTPLQPTNLLLDLGASLSLADCCTTNDTISSSMYRPVPCGSSLCKLLTSPAACSHCSEHAEHACANHSCHLFLSSPRHRKGIMVQALVDKLALPLTDGRNPGQLRIFPEFVLSCSTRSLLKGLVPRGMTGLAALGWSNFSLAMQVATASASPKVFALCLSGSPSAPGVAFFGTPGPYNFLPETDLSRYLNYTPLLGHHTHHPSNEYFIGLSSIKVNGRIVVHVNRTRMALAGAKLSLEAPYTILDSSIYAALTEAFVNESAVLKLTVTQPVTPFSVCFDAADVADTTTGPAVPTIDLVMHDADQKFWRIFGSNSMVRISRSSEGVDAWCLGFVNGGFKPQWPIVIGGHQMVDNLLQFDLESERLGYSSSVLVHDTMCANFNFTVNTSLTKV